MKPEMFVTVRTLIASDPPDQAQRERIARLIGPPPDVVAVPVLYSLPVAAKIFGRTRRTLLNWERDGRLPLIRVGRRCTRVRAEDVQKLIDQSVVTATAADAKAGA